MKNIPHVGLEGHIGPWHSDRNSHSQAAFKRNVVFINCLPMSVAIATRDGLRFVQERKNVIGESKLTIFTETTVDVNIKKQLMTLMNCRDIENSKELEIAKSYWSNMSTDSVSSYHGDIIRVEYSIPLELIKRYGGTVYLKDLDVAISIHGMKDDFYHPYSHAGEIVKGSVSSVKDSLASIGDSQSYTPNGANFIRSIKIIDNSGTIGTRYTKIGKEIYAIRPHKEPDMRSGIYVLTNSPVTNEVEKSEVISERYDDCDEIPDFKLHKSYLEALNDEGSAETRKIELAMRELEARETESANRTRRAEIDAEKLTVERDGLKRDLEASEIQRKHDVEILNKKIEFMREERETSKLKEEEDRKQVRRRGTVEFIKAVPVVITAGVGLYAFIKKATAPAPAPKT